MMLGGGAQRPAASVAAAPYGATDGHHAVVVHYPHLPDCTTSLVQSGDSTTLPCQIMLGTAAPDTMPTALCHAKPPTPHAPSRTYPLAAAHTVCAAAQPPAVQTPPPGQASSPAAFTKYSTCSRLTVVSTAHGSVTKGMNTTHLRRPLQPLLLRVSCQLGPPEGAHGARCRGTG
jgi:hypothetical protein